LSNREIAAQSVQQTLAWWDGRSVEIGRLESSGLHRLIQAWHDGIVVLPGSADMRLAEQMILSRPQVFLVRQDWVGLVGRTLSAEFTEHRGPFDQCAFEFNVSGAHIIYFEDAARGSMMALHVLRHWSAYPLDFQYRPEDGWDGPGRAFELAWENVRAISFAIKTGMATFELIEAPAALNKQRRARSRPLLSDYHVLRLHGDGRA